MKMKHLTVLMIMFAFLLLSYAEASAWQQRRPVTPYGDFCPRCGHYGTCKSIMSTIDAEQAMKDYYHKKAYTIEIENKRGRFIRAKVKEKGKVIDIIIFDRRTGRIRSIY
jgi:hypothetical protein